jgi:hypothetical protein
MRARATCTHCGRDFLFFQLYHADPRHQDRWPHCDHHLGVVGLRHLAVAVDRGGDRLVSALREIEGRDPRFTIKPDSVLSEIDHVVSSLASSPEAVAV